MPGPEITRVADEDTDLYGREYWFSHQVRDLGQPTIAVRSRTDLSERCLYWLRTMLKYKRPPGRVLELGSAHGGFVAMLRWAGFDATGLEISPWVVNFAQTTFDVPMLLGPVEEHDLSPASIDVIALMDVVEHLRDPVATLRHCVHLLKPDGILLVQTPRYEEGMSFEALAAERPRFADMLQPAEHLYLFSRSSISALFAGLGGCGVAFEPAFFAEYDMFLVVSRAVCGPTPIGDVGRSLRGASPARLVEALLDLGSRLDELKERNARAEDDRARRLAVIEAQGGQLGEVEAERNNLHGEVAALRAHVGEVEADREARLHLLEQQGSRVGELEAERGNLLAEVAAWREEGARLEADRTARLLVIEEQGARVGELEARWRSAQAELASQRERLEAALQESRERLEAALQESRELAAEVGAQQEQLDILAAHLRMVQGFVRAIQGARVYRWMRRLGRWRFADELTAEPWRGQQPEGQRR
jgi:2-polyprenyl-3-methyl-5-hydroxy-6-metoxy-1,4-benzoquinol methylase